MAGSAVDEILKKLETQKEKTKSEMRALTLHPASSSRPSPGTCYLGKWVGGGTPYCSRKLSFLAFLAPSSASRAEK